MKKKKDDYRHHKESYKQMILARILQKNGGINQRSLQIKEKEPVSTDE
jgi:hypothetical protein